MSWDEEMVNLQNKNQMSQNFRLACESDEEQLLELMEEFYHLEHLIFDQKVARSALKQLFRKPYFGLIYLIEYQGETAGYLVLTFGFSLEYQGLTGLLDELYLREPYRGKGLGKRSLEFLEEICYQQGVKAVFLEVDHHNTRAQKIYCQAGYGGKDRHLWFKTLEVLNT